MVRKVEAFVISMQSNEARRLQVRKIVTACPVPCSVVNAVNGNMLSLDSRNNFLKPALYEPYYPCSLRPAEVGCFLSHRLVWQMIVDKDLEGALILEDDVQLIQPAFGSSLERAFDSLRYADLVRLRLMERTPAKMKQLSRAKISRPIVSPLGTQAQVVSREGALRLLDSSQCFDRPVDVFLQTFWVSGIRIYEVSPSYVSDQTQSLGGSTIQVRTNGTRLNIRRNVKRLTYRLRIYFCSLFYYAFIYCHGPLR